MRGRVIQRLKAEQYPSIRWNFRWNDFVLVGVPDGITDDFVYEFKSTRSRFLLTYHKPVALAQANLGAHFFQRPNVRAQVHVMDEDRTETWGGPVDAQQVDFLLSELTKSAAGALPPPPNAW